MDASMSSKTGSSDSISAVAGHLRRWVSRGRRVGLKLLLPPRCASCNTDLLDAADGLLLCSDCRAALCPGPWHSCRRCGATALPEHPAPGSCNWCRANRLRFDRAVVLGAYRGELRKAVLRMKRSSSEPLSAALARLYNDSRGEQIASLRPDLAVPVPMFWARRLVRGTNSPEILADCLGRHLRVPLAGGVLFRRRNTLLQQNLPPTRRFRNVHDAFRLRASYHFDGARVLLVDDILTTGATCSEAARLLKQAGASMVAVAALARAEGDDSS